MKSLVSVSFTAIALAITFSVTPMAQTAEATPQANARFLSEVRDLVSRCAVQPYTIQSGKKAYGRLESSCPELQVQGAEARFQFEGRWSVAKIVDSEDSDGGDLNDISIQDDHGNEVAQLKEVLAFGDILLGLSDGQVNLPESYEQTLEIPKQN